jgi:hypothetical protein
MQPERPRREQVADRHTARLTRRPRRTGLHHDRCSGVPSLEQSQVGVADARAAENLDSRSALSGVSIARPGESGHRVLDERDQPRILQGSGSVAGSYDEVRIGRKGEERFQAGLAGSTSRSALRSHAVPADAQSALSGRDTSSVCGGTLTTDKHRSRVLSESGSFVNY